MLSLSFTKTIGRVVAIAVVTAAGLSQVESRAFGQESIANSRYVPVQMEYVSDRYGLGTDGSPADLWACEHLGYTVPGRDYAPSDDGLGFTVPDFLTPEQRARQARAALEEERRLDQSIVCPQCGGSGRQFGTPCPCCAGRRRCTVRQFEHYDREWREEHDRQMRAIEANHRDKMWLIDRTVGARVRDQIRASQYSIEQQHRADLRKVDDAIPAYDNATRWDILAHGLYGTYFGPAPWVNR